MTTAEDIRLTVHRATVSDQQRWERIEALQKNSDPSTYARLLQAKELRESQEAQLDHDATSNLGPMRIRTVSLAQSIAEVITSRSIPPEATLERRAAVQPRYGATRYEQTPLWYVTQRCVMQNEEFQLTTQKPDREGPLAKWIPIPPMYGVIVQSDILTSTGLRSSFSAQRTETPMEFDKDHTILAGERTVTKDITAAQPLPLLNPIEDLDGQLTEVERVIPLRLLLLAEQNRQQGLAELAFHYRISV